MIRICNINITDNHNEYQYPIEGFKKPVRFDILLQKDGTNFGIIEADGIQHYKYTPHFHNPKNDLNPLNRPSPMERNKKNDVIKALFKSLDSKNVEASCNWLIESILSGYSNEIFEQLCIYYSKIIFHFYLNLNPLWKISFSYDNSHLSYYG